MRTSVGAAQPARLLVAIPTLNEAGGIERIVRDLLAGTADLPDARIAVVDGGSTDGTTEIVSRIVRENPRVSMLRNPARIQSAAINLAARELGRDTDVLIRCDAHSSYPPDF